MSGDASAEADALRARDHYDAPPPPARSAHTGDAYGAQQHPPPGYSPYGPPLEHAGYGHPPPAPAPGSAAPSARLFPIWSSTRARWLWAPATSASAWLRPPSAKLLPIWSSTSICTST